MIWWWLSSAVCAFVAGVIAGQRFGRKREEAKWLEWMAQVEFKRLHGEKAQAEVVFETTDDTVIPKGTGLAYVHEVDDPEVWAAVEQRAKVKEYIRLLPLQRQRSPLQGCSHCGTDSGHTDPDCPNARRLN